MNAEQVARKLISWIKDRVMAAGCKGTVVGVSGGLDSSVVAVLCQQALAENMLGVIMPCHSQQEDTEHALALADEFSIPTTTVRLDEVYDALLKALPAERTDSASGQLAKANLKARLRMVTLYHFANRLRYLVVGSSNKSELSIGYFTKYGDGGVDIMPLGGLVKEEVRELASFLGIPRQIIDKPPSAGLWPGQTDEAELGLDYQALDRYLTTGEAADELKGEIEAMIAATSHKRSPPPIANL